ncbi:hypothetical protein ACU8YX_21450 [Bacillus paranthracis]
MLGVFKKHNNKTNVSILKLSKNQQITFNVPTNSELKIQMDMLHIFKRRFTNRKGTTALYL